ncbi:MAG: hypothetical protein OXD30_13860 [Bryobacterales bacterium]|nr:hypothetical protein [Bryobacterales bacterium]
MAGGSTARTQWTDWLGWAAAVVMAGLWLSAGLWKLTDISGWQVKLTQLLVPARLSLAGTLAVGVAEVVAGVLLLRPAWRRWGGWLSVALLAAFMGYMAVNYQALRGEDCSCFPWLERAVGPAFFWSDAAMLAVALLAVRFSQPAGKARGAVAAVLAVAVFAALMLGVERLRLQPGLAGIESIRVDGGAHDLRAGKSFLFFFNPSCLHCLHAGQTMAGYDWLVDFIGIPTQDPDWGPGFLEDAGLTAAKLSPDAERLRETFEFEDVPYGALLKDGVVLERLVLWEEPDLGETLRRHAFID